MKSVLENSVMRRVCGRIKYMQFLEDILRL